MFVEEKISSLRSKLLITQSAFASTSRLVRSTGSPRAARINFFAASTDNAPLRSSLYVCLILRRSVELDRDASAAPALPQAQHRPVMRDATRGDFEDACACPQTRSEFVYETYIHRATTLRSSPVLGFAVLLALPCHVAHPAGSAAPGPSSVSSPSSHHSPSAAFALV